MRKIYRSYKEWRRHFGYSRRKAAFLAFNITRLYGAFCVLRGRTVVFRARMVNGELVIGPQGGWIAESRFIHAPPVAAVTPEDNLAPIADLVRNQPGNNFQMMAAIVALLLCLPVSAQERKRIDPKQPAALQIDNHEPYKDSGAFTGKWSGQSPITSVGSYSLRLTVQNAAVVWMRISSEDVSLGWRLPVCTMENLKRAPKLTAWVMARQGFSSPQAKWLTALFENCGIKSKF